MSLRKAINDKCKDCIYDEAAPGTWRMQVFGCIMTDCSLYPYRPLPDKSYLQKQAKLAQRNEVTA